MAIRQPSIFELMNPKFKIDKPIRLIELFAGIGAQAKALELLGADFQSHRVVEWSAYSIVAYNAIHKGDFSDHSQGLTLEQLLDKVEGVSLDYNKPADRESLRRKGEPWLRKLYSSMVAINDLVPDVSRVKAQDLGITERYRYVLTYSFPCQDLSVAGKQRGMAKGEGTRSGLLWEVERILNELKAMDALPQVLVMENVPQVYSDKNLNPWNSWLAALRRLGYSNFFKTLNAKDYAIPQNRKRAFMVSVLGEWSYSFPREFLLRHPLKDFLDEDVSESYFLSEKIIKGYIDGNQKQADKGNGFCFSLKNLDDPNEVAFTIATKAGSRRTDNYIEVEDKGIRRLTGYECGKLMGFDRADFKKMSEAGLAKSTLYHSAGDSIVVTCLMGIFGEMIGNDYRDKIEARADALATQKGDKE